MSSVAGSMKAPNGTWTGRICAAPSGCTRPVESYGLCAVHRRLQREGKPDRILRCIAPPGTWVGKTCAAQGGCDRVAFAKGFCQTHYARIYRGEQDGPLRQWSGEGSITPDGYRVVYKNGKSLREHRVVLERMLGRPLLRTEEVHHKNGVRSDNRPENLELWSHSQPPGQRVIDKVVWAKELLALYESKACYAWDFMEKIS